MQTGITLTGTDLIDVLDFDLTHGAVFGLGGDDILHSTSSGYYTDLEVDGGDGSDTVSHAGTLRLGDGVAFSNVETLDVVRVKVASGATVDLSAFESSLATKIVGSGGAETITGTQDADLILTRGGDDVVFAGVGDTIKMGKGQDTLQYVQDGTAVLDVNAKGHGTITYGNGDIITFRSVEVFEEIVPTMEYVLDFNDDVKIEDGDTILDGVFVATIGTDLLGNGGKIDPTEYDDTVDADLEAFNTWGTQNISFAKADGDTFEFKSLSLANASRSDVTYIPEANWANSVQISGLLDGVVVYTQDVDLTFEHVTQDLNWSDIDEIKIVTKGGGRTENGLVNTGWYSMDDLVFIV